MNKKFTFSSMKKDIKESKMSSKAPMYIYATEMVGEYYSRFDLKNKRVLTISGSGDQVLGAIYAGAKEVVGFDLNKRSENITDLKITAISNLTYSEFLNYFGKYQGNSSFDKTLYKKIRTALPIKSRHFFDNLYKKYRLSEKKIANSEYFRKREDISKRHIKSINFYLKDEKSCLHLRNDLRRSKFKFVKSDITNVKDKLREKRFDIINLSNVPNYLSGRLKRQGVNEQAEYIFKNIFPNLKKILSKSGFIFYYSYSPRAYPNRIAKQIPPPSQNRNVNPPTD